MHAALVKDVVKVPAHTEPGGASKTAKSGLPEVFRPTEMPEALYPCGDVKVPLKYFQVDSFSPVTSKRGD
tara:strand:+ start:210 stop:419 length:210 start_codon:yes stop_codon:yes gene_type:complete